MDSVAWSLIWNNCPVFWFYAVKVIAVLSSTNLIYDVAFSEKKTLVQEKPVYNNDTNYCKCLKSVIAETFQSIILFVNTSAQWLQGDNCDKKLAKTIHITHL